MTPARESKSTCINSSVIVEPPRRKELKHNLEKMATKMSRKGKSNSSVSPARRGNMWPDKETHLSPKALPTILSDTSPQEEVGGEVRRRSRRSGAEQEEEEQEKDEEEVEEEDEVKHKSRRPRGSSSSAPQEEMLLQEGEGLTVRSLYR